MSPSGGKIERAVYRHARDVSTMPPKRPFRISLLDEARGGLAVLQDWLGCPAKRRACLDKDQLSSDNAHSSRAHHSHGMRMPIRAKVVNSSYLNVLTKQVSTARWFSVNGWRLDMP